MRWYHWSFNLIQLDDWTGDSPSSVFEGCNCVWRWPAYLTTTWDSIMALYLTSILSRTLQVTMWRSQMNSNWGNQSPGVCIWISRCICFKRISRTGGRNDKNSFLEFLPISEQQQNSSGKKFHRELSNKAWFYVKGCVIECSIMRAAKKPTRRATMRDYDVTSIGIEIGIYFRNLKYRNWCWYCNLVLWNQVLILINLSPYRTSMLWIIMTSWCFSGVTVKFMSNPKILE